MDKATRSLWMVAGAGIGGFLLARALKGAGGGYDLREKRVLITGGSRGLGLLLAREFGRRGAWVAICARDPQELESARQDLSARKIPALALTCDMRQRDQVEKLVEDVHQSFGRIDILVNNAGIIQVGPLEEMSVEDFEQAMDIHFWAPLYATLAVLPEMRQRHEGRIVNITSIGGKVSIPHLIPYDASKFALVGLSEGLHAELKKDGIVVTTVVPGLMRTGSQQRAQFKGRHEQEYSWFMLGGSSPLSSMNAERAAREIVEAVGRGQTEVTLSLQAKLLEKTAALFPVVVSEILGMVNRALPSPGGIGKESRPGFESRPEQMPETAAALVDEAAERNNEMRGNLWV